MAMKEKIPLLNSYSSIRRDVEIPDVSSIMKKSLFRRFESSESVAEISSDKQTDKNFGKACLGFRNVQKP